MPAARSSKQQSAGLLLYRLTPGSPEVLLGHPGGPFWSKKDEEAWTIPKGLMVAGETPLAAARREFAEDSGYRPQGKAVSLGEVRQPGGKVIHVWAVEDGWDASELRSNSFEMEWPPKSGRRQPFPELDRAAWFTLGEARVRILTGQARFLDRLEKVIGNRRRLERTRP
jgi:predicted NUDIX family NTP pyrophosphohydrolase